MTTRKSDAQELADVPVRDGEDAWTVDELQEVHEELESDIAHMRSQIETAESELADLLHEGNDGAGRDPADVGSINFERDQEMSLTANLKDMLLQSEHALARLKAGSYGRCEACGEPIGKGRLQAFPRATMCMVCKQREERR